MEKLRRWKRDVLGDFFEMKVGAREDWGVDWSGWVSHNAGDALQAVTWSLPAGLTKVSQQENGNQAKVTIEPTQPGKYWCISWIQTLQGNKAPFVFRVYVKAVDG